MDDMGTCRISDFEFLQLINLPILGKLNAKTVIRKKQVITTSPLTHKKPNVILFEILTQKSQNIPSGSKNLCTIITQS